MTKVYAAAMLAGVVLVVLGFGLLAASAAGVFGESPVVENPSQYFAGLGLIGVAVTLIAARGLSKRPLPARRRPKQ